MAKNTFIAVRVTPDIIKSLDEVARQRGISRSMLIRDLLANCHALYKFLETERERQRSDRILLNGNLSQWVLDNMPEKINPELLHFIGEVMHHAAEIKTSQEKEGQSDKA